MRRSGRALTRITLSVLVTVMRLPDGVIRRVEFVFGHHFRIDQFALALDRDRYPLSLCSVVAQRDEIKAARSQTLSEKHFRNVAYGNNPSTPQNHSFQPGGMMRESKNTARGDEFSNLVCRNGKPPFAQPQQDERLQLDFGRYRHCGESASSRAAAAAVLSACRTAASSKASSSGATT